MNLEKRTRLLNGFLSVVIVLMLIIGGISVFAETTTEPPKNGEVITETGEYKGLTWTLYDKKKLEITGSGVLDALDGEGNANSVNLPWHKYKDDIVTVIIGKDITEIGDEVFNGYGFLETVSLGPDIKKIGKNAFKSCKEIKAILIPASVTVIGEGAFSDCISLKTVYYASSKSDWDKISIGAGNAYIDRTKVKNFIDTSDSAFRFWDILNVPIGYILKFSYLVGRNYAIALLIFAIIMKIVLFPFGIKQQKALQKQAAFKPKELAIRKKYKGRTDKASQEKLRRELYEAQQKEGVSVFGGCMPLLIQLPIIFVLFSVIRNPLKYLTRVSDGTISVIRQRAIELGLYTPQTRGDYDMNLVRVMRENFDSFKDIKGLDGKIGSVSDLPNFTIFKGFDLSVKPEIASWLVLIPILTFVVMFVTSKINRKLTYQPVSPEGEDAMKSMLLMDIGFPLVSVYFAFQFPAIIGVYWIYQNIVGTGQQLVLKYMYPLPKFTEEDYKKAEREVMGKPDRKKRKAQSASRTDDEEEYETKETPVRKRNPKSLHYIDFDDDEDYTQSKEQQKSNKKSQGGNKKGSSMIGAAEMKTYDRKEDNESEESEDDEE